METKWLKEALFAGMTANAFKLGTVLTLGWFWMRVAGCSVLYRGSSMETIEFVNILTVADADAAEISPPSYMAHANSTTYFYVVRRANSCGEQEHTLSCAVKVSIDASGDLAEPQPNNVFKVRARQVNGNKIQLIWYYCPIEQESAPAFFKIYYDAGTEQIDYDNSIATIRYAGRRFYNYQSGSLEVDKYQFCIRAEDAVGTGDGSLAQIKIQLDTTSPDMIDILSAETV
jgi:hypothetical protein